MPTIVSPRATLPPLWTQYDCKSKDGRRYALFVHSETGRVARSMASVWRIHSGKEKPADVARHRPFLENVSDHVAVRRAEEANAAGIAPARRRRANKRAKPDGDDLEVLSASAMPMAHASLKAYLDRLDVSGSDGADPTVARWPAPSYVGRSVPHSIDVEADPDLPGWRVAEAKLVQTRQQERVRKKTIIVYISPGGEALYTRQAALRAMHRLQMSTNEYGRVLEELQRRGLHGRALRMPFVARGSFETRLQNVFERRRAGETWYGNYAKGAFVELLAQQYGRDRDASDDDVLSKLVVVDAFCGMGGLSLGMRAAGFSNIFGFDSLLGCIQTYRRNACGDRSLTFALQTDSGSKDIAQIAEACEKAGLSQRLVLVGGPPCQPFQALGARGGATDARDGLSAFVDLAVALRPLGILVENVGTLLDGQYADQLDHCYAKLQAAGYVCDARWLNSEEYAVPQRRRRAFITAVCANVDAAALTKHLDDALEKERIEPQPNASDAIPDDTFWLEASPSRAHVVSLDTIAARHRHDERVSAREERLTTRTTMSVLLPDMTSPTIISSTMTDSSFMRLLACPALAIPPSELAHHHLRATTLEHQLSLQTFPSGFEVHGGVHAQRIMLGNAVPPRLGHAAGAALASALKHFVLAHRQPEPTSDLCAALKTLKREMSRLQYTRAVVDAVAGDDAAPFDDVYSDDEA